MMPAACQSIFPDMMLLRCRRFENPHMQSVYKTVVNIKKRKPVLMTSQAYARCSESETSISSYGSQSPGLRIRFFHNLVNALSRQIVRIRDLAERHSLAAHAKNLRVSARIGRRPWLKRTPLPAWKRRQCCGFFCRKKTLLLALPDIPNPSADGNLLAIDDFNMKCRDSGVTGSLGKLLKSLYVQCESGVVVHGAS